MMRNSGLKKYLPIEYRHSIFDIDFEKYKNLGYQILFFDLDNTIADYETHYPDDKTIDYFSRLKELGFNIFILSNNNGERVKRFEDGLNIKGWYSLRKPFTYKIKKHILDDSMEINKILWIGDQAVTDVRCANKLNINSILLDPIKPSTEKWYTRVNRKFERMYFKKIERKMNDIFLELGLDKRV